jgi:hypothetical protein
MKTRGLQIQTATGLQEPEGIHLAALKAALVGERHAAETHHEAVVSGE